jgi:hypothetical protein
MASPVWNSHATRPLGVGGMAMFCGWVVAGSSAANDAILDVVALIAPAQVSWGDASATMVHVPLGTNGLAFESGIPSLPRVISWFAQTPLGWVAGPVDSVDFASSWSSSFNYPKHWAVDFLQQLERDTAPLGATRLEIRSSFPRDDIPLPCISVQFEASPQSQKILGNMAKSLTATTFEERIPWNVSLSLQLWCDTPEERDVLAPWYLGCMQALSAVAPHNAMDEPIFQFQENEDFSMGFYDRPLFLLTGNLSGVVWSKLTLPVHNWIGVITV